MPLRLAGIGAERQAWRAEETLRGLGGRPARPRGSAGPLSARQMEVARLVADGTPTEIRCARRQDRVRLHVGRCQGHRIGAEAEHDLVVLAVPAGRRGGRDWLTGDQES